MSFEYAPWPLPANVHAGWTTRRDGYSRGVLASNNVARHVMADDAVELNRQRLQNSMTGQPAICWLNQTHSCQVVSTDNANLSKGQDGCFTQQVNDACCVMTADCLPVFFWSRNGEQVAVAHAGWRGLALGILSETLATFKHPSQVCCGIGPAISQAYFEVGTDVVAAFRTWPQAEQYFKPGVEHQKFWCDLPALASAQLRASGVTSIYASNLCTYALAERFYSYRRDGVTGRMANVIWKTA